MYAIRPMFKLLLTAVPAVCGLLFAVNVILQKQSLQMKDGIRKCIKALPVILAVSFAGGVLYMVYLGAGAPYSGSFKMSYTYPRASKGLTPNSTTLDVSEIFSDEVLELAVQTGLLGDLTADEIKNTLRLDNVKQRDGVSVDNLYVSTEYRISYQATDATASLDKDILLETIADTYYDFFVLKYGRKTDMLETDYSRIDELDYLDINTYLDRRANAIIEYMDMCSRENSTFVSEATGESFGTIRDKAKNFQEVSLERNKAYILKYGISKDKEQYISRLNYGNRIENVEYMKNLAAYRVRLSAIQRYDGDITRAVLVPTRDDDGEFYQSRTKIGTDYFADEANSHLQYATLNQLNIETNNYYIESLSRGMGDESHSQKADEMVESLKNELISISNQAAKTVEDYDVQTSNAYITFVFQDEGAYLRSCIKKAVVYAVVLGGILSAAIFSGTGLHIRKRRRS